MSERTTIGGTVYEAIGSSSANLLLKCNGTARIQWGNKLIDLVKNGKIASEDSQELIFIVNDESEIKSDGVYILTTGESNQLWVSKDGNKYNFTDTDLYISASKQQNLTDEQKTQVLNNIGIQYNTLEEVKASGIKNGIVYVSNTKTLYTVKDGLIEEFEAKIKTVTVGQDSEGEKLINSSVKIVLSILDEEYLVLADQRIIANYPIHIKNSVQLGSENSDENQGYRLYTKNDVAFLDVDKINIRKSLIFNQNKEITLSDIYFCRGMILMHSGITPIPEGWAICDGGTYEWNGVQSQTPDLRNRFIKAVSTVEEIKASDPNPDLNENGKLVLKEEHLPSHTHPHEEHTHILNNLYGSAEESGTLQVSGTGYIFSHKMEAVQSVQGPEDVEITTEKGDSGEYYSQDTLTYLGGNHTHNISISGGEIQNTISQESKKEWLNQPITIEPNYYSLIFIMKL